MRCFRSPITTTVTTTSPTKYVYNHHILQVTLTQRHKTKRIRGLVRNAGRMYSHYYPHFVLFLHLSVSFSFSCANPPLCSLYQCFQYIRPLGCGFIVSCWYLFGHGDDLIVDNGESDVCKRKWMRISDSFCTTTSSECSEWCSACIIRHTLVLWGWTCID